ncbi:MAG: SAM-dependent methyltransferase, partial [Trebonia sp.]
PTAGNTHQVAQAIAPQARVVYVDYDPIVLAHARALLTSTEPGATEYIEADVRDTGAIIDQASQFLDFTRPVAVTLLALLHAIPDADDPRGIVARLLDAVPSGSYLAISHAGSDLLDREKHDSLMGIADRMIQNTITYRGRDELARFFDGTTLVEPGLVRVEEWRPDPEAPVAKESTLWCAVGRKRLSPQPAPVPSDGHCPLRRPLSLSRPRRTGGWRSGGCNSRGRRCPPPGRR